MADEWGVQAALDKIKVDENGKVVDQPDAPDAWHASSPGSAPAADDGGLFSVGTGPFGTDLPTLTHEDEARFDAEHPDGVTLPDESHAERLADLGGALGAVAGSAKTTSFAGDAASWVGKQATDYAESLPFVYDLTHKGSGGEGKSEGEGDNILDSGADVLAEGTEHVDTLVEYALAIDEGVEVLEE